MAPTVVAVESDSTAVGRPNGRFSARQSHGSRTVGLRDVNVPVVGTGGRNGADGAATGGIGAAGRLASEHPASTASNAHSAPRVSRHMNAPSVLSRELNVDNGVEPKNHLNPYGGEAALHHFQCRGLIGAGAWRH